MPELDAKTSVILMVELMKREFGKIERISMVNCEKLIRLVRNAEDAAILLLSSEQIRWVTPLARNEMNRRGLTPRT